MLSESIQDVEYVLAYVVSAVDGNGIGDDGSLVSSECRVSQRANEKPRKKPDVVNAIYKLLGPGIIYRILVIFRINGAYHSPDSLTLVEH